MSGGTGIRARPAHASASTPTPLATGELTLSPLDAEDETIVRALVEKHLAETESPKARDHSRDWDDDKARFTRVLPAQYARVREQLAEIEANGRRPERAGRVGRVPGGDKWLIPRAS